MTGTPDEPTDKRFYSDRRGSMAVFAILFFAAAALITGGVVDFMSLVSQKRDVQSAADAAAIGAAREMQVATGDRSRMDEVAHLIAATNLKGYRNPQVDVRRLADGGGLEVEVSVDPRVFFSGPVAMNAKRVTANAVAQVAGAPVCMIGLDPKVENTLLLRKKSSVQAVGCAIYSNSKSKDGIRLEDNAQVEADFICSAGGVKTSKKQALDPEPVTDCPTIGDPLAGRPAPGVGVCDETNFKLAKNATANLSPGVYCGGMDIRGKATLKPGVYVIRNGRLVVDEGGSVTGDHVGFFLTGSDAMISFERNSTIDLSAPKSGALTGLLFYEDRNTVSADDGSTPVDGPPPPPETKTKEHRIRSDNARRLVGTIYIPKNRLLIDGDKPVAAESEYTVIIARQFALAEGPVVVLNTDYASSDVPVPEGVGNNSPKEVRLVR